MNLQERALFAALDDEERRRGELRAEARSLCERVLGTTDVDLTDVRLGEKRVFFTCDGLEFRAAYRHIDGEMAMALEMNTGQASWMDVPDLATLGRWLRNTIAETTTPGGPL
jgi:hypothetical protein